MNAKQTNPWSTKYNIEPCNKDKLLVCFATPHHYAKGKVVFQSAREFRHRVAVSPIAPGGAVGEGLQECANRLAIRDFIYKCLPSCRDFINLSQLLHNRVGHLDLRTYIRRHVFQCRARP